jgi:hypothetical protein
MERGTLEPERYESYQKLQREIQFQITKNNSTVKRLEKERDKKTAKQLKNNPRNRDKQ